MRKLQEINIFIFFIFLSIGLFIGLIFPDFDQSFQKLLGHRSIITHSILLPYLIYFYQIVKKEKPNNNIVYICIGIFLGIAIHLSADLFPKGWRGYALIKFIGDISYDSHNFNLENEITYLKKELLSIKKSLALIFSIIKNKNNDVNL